MKTSYTKTKSCSQKASYFYKTGILKYHLIIIVLLFFISNKVKAQNREDTYNSISWLAIIGDHKISKHWEFHTDYQIRRANFISHWQQSNLKLGVTYNVTSAFKLNIGYGNIQTFEYGEQPVSRPNNQGESQVFPEHRLHVGFVLKNNTGILEITHRLRVEERWLGTFYDANNDRIPGKWKYMTRFRYRVKAAFPLQGKTIDDGEFFLHAYDEVLIGAGENVGANIFDQNRINVGIGYRFNKDFKIEVGYINQFAQKGRLDPVKKIPVFEYNHGILMNIHYNIDFTELLKRKEKNTGE